MNYFIFGKALGKFSTWGGLWTCTVLPGSSGFWKASGLDLFIFGGLVWTGGWIDGRFFTAEEIAEFEQVMLLEEFWRDFFLNLFNPSASNRGTV